MTRVGREEMAMQMNRPGRLRRHDLADWRS